MSVKPVDANLQHNTAMGMQVSGKYISDPRPISYFLYSCLKSRPLRQFGIGHTWLNLRAFVQMSRMLLDIDTAIRYQTFSCRYDIWFGEASSGSPASSASSYEM